VEAHLETGKGAQPLSPMSKFDGRETVARKIDLLNGKTFNSVAASPDLLNYRGHEVDENEQAS
jgi:hypothetical protein